MEGRAKKIGMRKKWLLGALSLLALLGACSKDVEQEYAPLKAFFRCTNVSTVLPLQRALGTPGQYCMIEMLAGQRVGYVSEDGSRQEVRLTQSEMLTRPLCVEGFIVGTPALPNAQGKHECVAYDLVCPNCYYDDDLNKRLRWNSMGRVACSRCQRVYLLGTNGIVGEGKKGRPLFKYHVNHNHQGACVISN